VSKAIKDLIVRDYRSRLGNVSDAMLIGIRGVKAIPAGKMRRDLAGKKIRVTVLRNALAKKAFAGTPLEPLSKLLSGSNAAVYGGSSVIEVAREIVKIVATIPEVELRGAVLDGQLYEGKKGVEELSRYPTKSEAIANIVTLVVSPARKLVAQVKGPGAQLAGVIKAIEQKLEKGETISRRAG
jgi:large subunit ribosomal protein L10